MSEFPLWLILVPPILSLQVGLFVFFASRASALNRIFLAASVSVTLWNLENAWTILAPSVGPPSFLRLGVVFLPAAFLHLVVAYASRSERRTAWLVVCSYAAAVITASLTDKPFLGPMPGQLSLMSEAGLHPLSLPQALYSVYFVLSISLSARILWHKLRRTESVLEKRQILLVGFSVALAVLSGIGGIFYHQGFLFHQINAVASFSYLAGLGWAIGRYRFGNTSGFLRTSAIYSFVLAIIIGLYVGIIVLLGRWADTVLGLSPLLLALLVTVGVGPLFFPLQQLVSKLVGRFFPLAKDVYYEGLVNFSQELNFVLPLPQLSELISVRLAHLLNLETVVLAVTPERIEPFMRVVELHRSDPPEHRSRLIPLPRRLPVDAVALSARLGLRVTAVLPLESRGRRVGLLGVGRHLNGDDISTEDWDVINSLGRQAGIALENAELYSQLVQMKNHYLAVVESSVNGILTVDSRLKITDANRAAGSILGERQDLINRPLREIPCASPLVDLVKQVLETGVPIISQETLLPSPNQPVPFAVNVSLLSGSDPDEAGGALIAFSNLSTIKAMERQVDRAERLAALGHLSAGLAHEIRNALNKIGGYAIMLEDHGESNPGISRLARGIQEDVAGIAETLTRVLSFAREGKSVDVEISLVELVSRAVKALSPKLQEHGVHATISGDPGGGVVYGDTLRLEQALLNLILNASEAMENGGAVEISVGETKTSVVVTVRDHGPGIPPALRETIFNPFFTTKPKGTGLGLPITHRIINEHGGTLELEPAPGGGARFVVTLPKPSQRRTVYASADS